MRWSILAAAAVSSVLAIPSLGDEVYFKNGDRISGTIETMDAGKMVIKTKVAGKITVDMKDVKTFSSNAPVSLRLNDSKTIITQKVETGPDGQVALAAGGTIAPQPVALANLKSVNFKEDWTGNIVADGALTRGNTESENLNLSIHLTRRTEIDRITFDAGYLYGRQRSITSTNTVTFPNGKQVVNSTSKVEETQNDWFIGGQYDYYFSKKFYGYFNARLEKDTIAGIALRVTPGGGFGYDWIDKPDHHFHTEAGISWLYRDYSGDPAPKAQESVAVRLAYHYDRKLTDKLLLFHNFEYFPALDNINNYYFRTDIGVRTPVTDKWFAEFKIQEEYDERPALGKGYNDTQFRLGLGYTL